MNSPKTSAKTLQEIADDYGWTFTSSKEHNGSALYLFKRDDLAVSFRRAWHGQIHHLNVMWQAFQSNWPAIDDVTRAYNPPPEEFAEALLVKIDERKVLSAIHEKLLNAVGSAQATLYSAEASLNAFNAARMERRP